jgi:hypothetical protein
VAGPWTAWEPYAVTRPWLLTCTLGQTCTVYGQFRDGAGNESLVISDDVVYAGLRLYLPMIQK